MKLTNAIKKCETAGYEVTHADGCYRAVKGRRVIIFHRNGGGSDQATAFGSTRTSAGPYDNALFCWPSLTSIIKSHARSEASDAVELADALAADRVKAAAAVDTTKPRRSPPVPGHEITNDVSITCENSTPPTLRAVRSVPAFETPSTFDALASALSVFTLDERLVAFLDAYDPQALKQARRALDRAKLEGNA